MITANFSAYSTYVTDSLNQWDINQVLRVTGLNLASAPEVHFSNANTGRAIPRQAGMENHVVTVGIPNSLLQDPLRIFAHIGIYEGDTFKVVEKVEIPVKPRKRPEDYQITDADEEIYSFKRLENALANAATKAQVANIIAHNNDTNGNTELVDIRVGANNKVYNSAGDAVRGQAEEILNRLNIQRGKNLYTGQNEVDGYLTASGEIVVNPDAPDWRTTDFIDIRDADTITSSGIDDTGKQWGIELYFLTCYNAEGGIVSHTVNPGKTYTKASGVVAIRFSYHSAVYTGGLQVEAGTMMTAYEPYKETVNFKGSMGLLRWAVLGDSLTEKNAKAAKNYHDYVADDLGCTIVNYGSSGTGYKRAEAESKAFYQRIQNVDPNGFDILTIFGSGNDSGASAEIGDPADIGTTTLCGCINTTIDNFYAVAPGKVLALVTPCPWYGYPPTTDGNWMEQYSDAIVAIAKRRGLPCLDLYHGSGMRPWDETFRVMFYNENGVQDEGVHPNSEGHRVFLYPKFREFIKTLY